MNRWCVVQDEATCEWVAGKLNLAEVFVGLAEPEYRLFSTWRRAYEYALNRARSDGV